MSISNDFGQNTDYAQYLALAEHDAILEDTLNGIKNDALQHIQEEDLTNERNRNGESQPSVAEGLLPSDR